jgi:hypothetical protein
LADVFCVRFPRFSIPVALASTLLAGALLGGVAGAAGAPPSGSAIRLDTSLPIHPMLQYGAQVEP